MTPSTSNELSVVRNGNQTAQPREVQELAWLKGEEAWGCRAEQDEAGASWPDWDTSLPFCRQEGRCLLKGLTLERLPEGRLL